MTHHVGYPDRLNASPLDDHYLPGRLIVKLESNVSDNYFMQSADYQTVHTETLQKLETFLESYDVKSMTPVFGPNTLSNLQELKRSRPKISSKATELTGSLQRTYVINYRSGEDPKQLATEIEKIGGVVYAEPHYTYQTADVNILKNQQESPEMFPSMQESEENKYIPNDPLIDQHSQNLFDYMNIFKAWGVNRGSSDVVIAIVDTGVYYDHPDLKDNLWYNPEPGLADDYFAEFEILNDTIGWNFWESGDVFKGEEPEQNANPVGKFSRHGTRVAGVAAAVTDNAEGIAGVGFQTQYMPVKVGGTKDYPNSLPFAIHGIIYAAINGADVINCSFVGTGNSRFSSDAITFAQEMGAVVIAAIGNNGISTTGTYPASFDDVLAVGAVRDSFDDRITHFSNFGYKVDVFAVGQSVMSTTFEYDDEENLWVPGYQPFTGTSAATPIVSGLAGLLKAEYPDWPAQRIASQISGTARSIRHANPEQQYEDKLGNGVIDAFAALTENVPVIHFTDYVFTKEQNQKINVGESGVLTAEGVHFGSPSPELFFKLESMQPGITIHTERKAISDLGPGEIFNIVFSISIDDDYSLDSVPGFRLTWSAGDIEDPSYQGTHIILYDELLYGNMENNRITMSIPSDGTLGFMHPDDNSIGIGFIPGGFDNILSESGIMISGYRDVEQVIINQVRDSTGITRHFLPVKNFRFDNAPSYHNTQVGSARFHSVNHPIARELEIELEAITPIGRSDSRPTIFLNFHVTNVSDFIYRDIHFGIFNHWEIREEGPHSIHFSEEQKLMYVRHESSPLVAGIATRGNISGALAINNESTMTLDQAESRSDSLSFGIIYHEDDEHLDGFTDAEKYLALTSGTERTTLSADNVSMVFSTGPYTLHPHSQVTIGFIYVWEQNAQRLINEVSSALGMELLKHDESGEYAKTGKVADELTLYANYPNPFNNQTNLRFDLRESTHVELAVYDLLGRRVVMLVNEVRDQGPHFVILDGSSMASGTYIAILRADGNIKSEMMLMVK